MNEASRLTAELETCFLRPTRTDIGVLREQLDWRRDSTGPELWRRALQRGLLPPALGEDPRRGFLASRKQLRALGVDADHGRVWREPPTAELALLLASDPAGVLDAEALARELLDRLLPWTGPPCGRILWRVCGPAEVPARGRGRRPHLYGIPSVLNTLFGPATEPVHGQRFLPVAWWLAHELRWRADTWTELPAVVEAWGERVELGALAGRRTSELPSPFAPFLELVRRGYMLEAIELDGTLRLATPAWPRRRSSLRFDNRRARAVWWRRTSAMRILAARGDVGLLREHLPCAPRLVEAGEPPLTSFAVYGGANTLACLAAHDSLELEARDGRGATPLMYAAGLPTAGPLGARDAELAAPSSALAGAEACTYLARAGAELEAVDERGRTALHWAVEHGREPCVAALLAAGAQLDAPDHLGRTPLMLAVSRLPRMATGSAAMELLGAREAETPALIEQLLSAKPDVDARDCHGWTVLHHLAAATGGVGQRRLGRRLVRAGALASRDQLGFTPARLCELQGVHHSDGGPFDPRHGVAAGAGPRPRATPPAGLVERLTASCWRLPPIARDHRKDKAWALLDDWRVWADWLQAQGDPRGELVATSLACVGLGGRKLRAQQTKLRAVAARARAWTEHPHLRALHGAHARRMTLRRTHGFVVCADLARADLGVDEQLMFVRSLAVAEPLLCELRVGREARFGGGELDWDRLLTGLAALEPVPSLRRLELLGLPPELPDLSPLRERFPNLASLVLYPRTHLRTGELAWPELRHLRIHHPISHGLEDTSVGLQVDAPALTHLELGLRRHASTTQFELADPNAVALVPFITSLPRVEHLRVAPAPYQLVTALLASELVGRLHSLELCEFSTTLTDQLALQGESIAQLERLGLVVRNVETASWYREQLAPFVSLHTSARLYR